MDIVMFRGVITDSMSQPSISSLEIVERAYESKNCVGLLTVSARRWGGERYVMFRPRSRASRSPTRFARVLVDFRKGKENNVCVQASTDMQFCLFYFSFVGRRYKL